MNGMAMENPVANKMNNDAIFSIILGVASLVIPFIGIFAAIAGIIFSFKSLKTIKVTNETGKGLAITGLVSSIVCILFYILAIVLLIFMLFFIFMDITSSTYYY